jgi:hypothetical protein
LGRLVGTALVQGVVVAAVVGAVYVLAPGAVLGVFLDPGVPADSAALAVAGRSLTSPVTASCPVRSCGLGTP